MKMTTPIVPVSLALAALATSGGSAQAQNAANSSTSAQNNAGAGQVQRIELAPALYEVAFSARANAIFVASAGGREEDAPQPRIYRLNPQTLAVEAEIPLERNGLGLVVDDVAGRLYVGNAFHASVTVIDTTTNQVIGVAQLAEKQTLPGFDGKTTERYPHNLRELVVDRAHNRLFAPGIWITDSVLYVMNTDSLTLEKMIPGFGFGAAGVTLDEAAGKLYVSNMQGQVLTVDSATLELDGIHEVAADQLLNLTLDRSTGRVLATDHGGDGPNTVRSTYANLPYELRGSGHRVVAIDPATGELAGEVQTGKLPVALLIDETRHRLWVTNRGSGTVTVYDSRDNSLLRTFDLPSHPNSLALDKASGAVFVTIKSAPDATTAESVARIQF